MALDFAVSGSRRISMKLGSNSSRVFAAGFFVSILLLAACGSTPA